MKLDFFMLADKAEAPLAEDGSRKLNIVGGGVTHVRADKFPYTLPSIAIVVRFFLEKEDGGSKHTFEVNLVAPDGQRLLTVGHQMEIAEIAPAHQGEEPSLFVVGELGNVLFQREGRYVMELTLDGVSVDSKGLSAIAAEEPPKK